MNKKKRGLGAYLKNEAVYTVNTFFTPVTTVVKAFRNIKRDADALARRKASRKAQFATRGKTVALDARDIEQAVRRSHDAAV